MVVARSKPPAESSLLGRLSRLSGENGSETVSRRLSNLKSILTKDLARVEAALSEVVTPEHIAGQSASQLLSLSGKRLRPLCVALAARTGSGFNPAALNIGVAVELVHSATLLHDDVVDVGTTRRNQPCARLLYGNAAAIFGGDWLLVAALRRVIASGLSGAVDEVLDVIEKMIEAEAMQLEARGSLDFDIKNYMRIIEGKTAVLFHWAMGAGARAGEQTDEAVQALENYGRNLGLAFQIVDDTLDLTGEAAVTGKALFTDLREGKMTYPLIIGAQRDKGLVAMLEEVNTNDAADELSLDLRHSILGSLVNSGAVETSMAFARDLSDQARKSLSALPPSAARTALELVAEEALHRKS
ncbi:MAG: polyprenyl synthetase family protein [Myxococcota bacterium]|nr:polyprenyl synthetase family protein [Myxococcota bacterium]